MNKTIVLVEDEIYPLQEMLLSVQNILFFASLEKLKNAPQDNDTEICVLHVLWDDQSGEYREDEKKDFYKFKRELEKYREDFIKEGDFVPIINYEYKVVELCRQNYIRETLECKDIVCNMIKQICNGKDYAIILDVVLNKKSDTNIVLEEGSNSLILSQLLYKEFSSNCVPYTNYSAGGTLFRRRWSTRVAPNKRPYDRNEIICQDIHEGFMQEINNMLKIGGI